MDQAIPYQQVSEYTQVAARALAYKPRPRYAAVMPGVLTVFPMVSYVAGGSPFITDIGWFALLVGCFYFLWEEVWSFPNRFGVGGIIWWSGIPLWFIWDYWQLWSTLGPGGTNTYIKAFSGDPQVIALASVAHFVFFTTGTIALGMIRLKPMATLITRIPQPRNMNTLFWMVVILFLMSLIPYFFFTKGTWYDAIWSKFTGFRASDNPFTVGRTGRLNTSWGAYILYLLKLLPLAGLIGAFYAIFYTRSVFKLAVCWFIYVFALAEAFGTGTRSHVLAMAAPLLGMVFIYYNATMLGWWRRMTPQRGRAIVICILIAGCAYLMMQIQGYNRRGSVAEISMARVELADPRDNTMFSHSLPLFERIPADRPPFYSRIPGETWVRPFPDVVIDFFYGLIPRALWPSKPPDAAIDWANTIKGGAKGFGQKGATMSAGVVGWFWLRYGWSGAIQGGLIFGLLLSIIDQAIWRSRAKPLTLIFALAIAQFMFRSFRDLRWIQFYQTLIAIIVYCMIVFTYNFFFGQPAQTTAPNETETA